MINLGTKKLTAQRVILRPFVLDDAEDMFMNWANDTDVTKYLSWEAHESVDVTRKYILSLRERYKDNEFYNWGIELKEIRQVIGSISARCNSKTQSVHISYCIGKLWWNKKITREAVQAVTQFFMEEVNVNRIESCFEAGNITAGKVLLRCGFQGEGTLRQAYYGVQGITNLTWYAMLRDDYLRKKKMNKLTIENLYITNYRETGGLPLRNILRLSEDEIYKMAEQLSDNTTSRNNRYGCYFERYYQKRKNTEEWLYRQFIKNGGKPQTKHPIYFVLCESSSFQKFYGNEEKIQIPIRDIASEYLSFTPRDSMHLRDMGLSEGTVWNKNVFLNMMQESGRAVSDFIIDLPGVYGSPGGYIEVQLWNDEYIEDLL